MFIFDGNPNGRIMCELSNWNGRVYKISRNEISEFSQRDDSENTGVYFLFGKNEENNDTVYIGEAEKIATRLKQHLLLKIYTVSVLINLMTSFAYALIRVWEQTILKCSICFPLGRSKPKNLRTEKSQKRNTITGDITIPKASLSILVRRISTNDSSRMAFNTFSIYRCYIEFCYFYRLGYSNLLYISKSQRNA